ncbi:hypothetical protein Aduo_008337 [Ancylostoma duodenale]
MRVDSVLEMIIALVLILEEHREIEMARGLREGRCRLQEQNQAHALIVQIFGRSRESMKIVAESRWTFQNRSGVRYVEQDICICDAKVNDHCQKNDCGACAYAKVSTIPDRECAALT